MERRKRFCAKYRKIPHRQALMVGFNKVAQGKLLLNSTIKQIKNTLVDDKQDFRKISGTVIKNNTQIVYTPPQNFSEIAAHLKNLEVFINDSSVCALDPLLKLCRYRRIPLIHHQFESIHPCRYRKIPL